MNVIIDALDLLLYVVFVMTITTLVVISLYRMAKKFWAALSLLKQAIVLWQQNGEITDNMRHILINCDSLKEAEELAKEWGVYKAWEKQNGEIHLWMIEHLDGSGFWGGEKHAQTRARVLGVEQTWLESRRARKDKWSKIPWGELVSQKELNKAGATQNCPHFQKLKIYIIKN